MQIFESVPNISEGRDRHFLERLAALISSAPQVRLLDWSADPDHNRSVFTFIGTEQGIIEANLALCAEVI
jgi:glutamate formiminotransferase